jgi:ribonuclease HII
VTSLDRAGTFPRTERSLPDYELERTAIEFGARYVCGMDEVGRGPWAGPIVAAAVILDPQAIPEGLDDSKRLTAKRRKCLHDALLECAHVGIGEASVEEIAALNISGAGFLAMERAMHLLPVEPDLAMVDGQHLPPSLPCRGRAIIGGDARSASIAAASIVAKVYRDRCMVALAQQFGGYGWETNVGYGTRAHMAGLLAHGVTPHHRRTFQPIHNILTRCA